MLQTLTPIARMHWFSLRRGGLSGLFVLIAAFFLLGLFSVWTRLTVINLEYELARLDARLREQTQLTAQLELEESTLSQPQRIEELARRKLGLQRPEPHQMVLVE